MKPFLHEVTESILKSGQRIEDLTIIFPNRRSALFFRYHLSQLLTMPVWSPALLSIEEFFARLSDLQELDKLELICRLHKIHKEVMQNDEPFDRFYFWGEMLLRDFDELDKYLVNGQQLFKDLRNLRELDETFDYLTEDQKGFLKSFWETFKEKPEGSKEEFLKVWKKLPMIYSAFAKTLRKDQLGYEGLIQRQVAEKIQSGKLKWKKPGVKGQGENLIFAGFNALTRAEEIMFSHFVSEGAQVFWDTDGYYLDDVRQEAGQFFRQYQKLGGLGKTFEQPPPTHLKSKPKTITVTAVPQRIGQAKLLGQHLNILFSEPAALEREKEGTATVVVLPDESMLLPVLHSLPPGLDSVNVTMGYPLRETPLFHLLDLMLELQIQRRGEYFSHRQVNAILSHPYVVSLEEDRSNSIRREVIDKNRILIRYTELQAEGSILSEIFKPVNAREASSYLLSVVQRMGSAFPEKYNLDREYAFHFHRHLSRLHEVLSAETFSAENQESHEPINREIKGFQKLFRQVIQSQRIPFFGEPLKGLQVMGVLETRNLDFDNVFVLSLNEGNLPASPRQGSYIPHNIRKAYGLPTFDHQDAIYSYLFYRMLQRASNIHLYYNSEPDVLGMGEMSRLLRQLILESGLVIDHRILYNPVQLNTTGAISFPQNETTLALLNKYTHPERPLSPSALNDYIDCRLRFYLKYLAGLYEADEVEEDLDARVFGNLLHNIMHWFYEDLKNKKGNDHVEMEDFSDVEEQINRLIDRAFIFHYHLDPQKPVEYEGQRVVVREVVKEFARRILKLDAAYAPFRLAAIESKLAFPANFNSTSKEVWVGGKIDRVDEKEGVFRVIDYKTGKDELDFENVDSLFARDGKRNKAAFQTFFYALIFQKTNVTSMANPKAIVPGLMNRKNIFKGDFKFGHQIGKGNEKHFVSDVRKYLDRYELLLYREVEELFNPSTVYDQTAEHDRCEYCSFKNICRR